MYKTHTHRQSCSSMAVLPQVLLRPQCNLDDHDDVHDSTTMELLRGLFSHQTVNFGGGIPTAGSSSTSHPNFSGCFPISWHLEDSFSENYKTSAYILGVGKNYSQLID